MTEKKIGDLIDSLGVTLDLDDGDMVSDCVVIAKTVDGDGEVSVGIGSSESLTWLDQIGLLTAASDIVRQGFARRDDED